MGLVFMSSLGVLAVGGRKDSIEGETYSKIPLRLQEHSLVPSESPLANIYRTRSSTETPQDRTTDDPTNSRGKNNHDGRSDLNSRGRRKIHHRSQNASLPPRTSIRIITNRSRLLARRSFKFRRKNDCAPSKPVALSDDVDENISDDEDRLANDQLPKITIEQMRQQQWIQVLQRNESKRMNAAADEPRNACHFSPLSSLDENDSCLTTDDELLDQFKGVEEKHLPNSSYESTSPGNSTQSVFRVLTASTSTTGQKSTAELTDNFRGKNPCNHANDPLK